MRVVRVLTAAALVGAGLLGTAPAEASLPMKFWVEYAGTGTIAFACHNVGYTAGTGGVTTANYVRVSCTFNGVTAASVSNGGWHATATGIANGALGSTARVCISASAVYGLHQMTEYRVDDACYDVVLSAAGTVRL